MLSTCLLSSISFRPEERVNTGALHRPPNDAVGFSRALPEGYPGFGASRRAGAAGKKVCSESRGEILISFLWRALSGHLECVFRSSLGIFQPGGISTPIFSRSLNRGRILNRLRVTYQVPGSPHFRVRPPQTSEMSLLSLGGVNDRGHT